MTNLKDKQVFVTGACSGLGEAVARAVVAAGGTVRGGDINRESGPAIASAAGFEFVPLDVSSESDWQRVAEQVKTSGLDHLHLNAGIQSAPPNAPMEEYRFGAMQLDRYRKLVGVNIDGVVLGLYYLLPHMNPGGSIVVTGSLAGLVPYDIDPLYSMTKHAVTGLVRSLKRELATQDLRINALCPGGIDTGIIPHDQRTDDAVFMTPDHAAAVVLDLFATTESGATWAKVRESKPAYIMEPPGSRKNRS